MIALVECLNLFFKVTGGQSEHQQTGLKEMNVTVDRKPEWRIQIFSDYVNEKMGLLSVSDIVWINLSEEDVIFAIISKRILTN